MRKLEWGWKKTGMRLEWGWNKAGMSLKVNRRVEQNKVDEWSKGISEKKFERVLLNTYLEHPRLS